MKTQAPILESVAIDSLIPYARNSRTHSPEQVAQIAASIREFGFTNPVLIDADGGIIAGHGRVIAARTLGMDAVPCIRLAHLTDAQRRAYVIADNRIALNAGWDYEMLAVELDELRDADFDIDLLGFDQKELDELIGSPDFDPGTQEQQSRLDELAPKMVKCPHCGESFDARAQD
jgi:ParB family transcriptional regulator, chromosome partitioning protein